MDLGFRADRVLTFDVNLPAVRYAAGAARRSSTRTWPPARSDPGRPAAGGTSRLPVTGSLNPWPLRLKPAHWSEPAVMPPELPEHRTVSGEFFQALAIPALAGRTFDDRDDAREPMRAVVSANLARMAFPGMPLDRMSSDNGSGVLIGRPSREIIGVVGDVTVDVYGKPSGAIYSRASPVRGQPELGADAGGRD